MATAPNVQIAINAAKIRAFWEVDLEGFYPYWRLYVDTDSAMGSEHQVLGDIPNIANTYYSKRHVIVDIDRPAVETVAVYLRIKGVMVGGAEDTPHPSPTRYVPATNEIDPMIKQKIFGFDSDYGIWRPVMVSKDTDLNPSIAGILDVRGWTGI